MTPSDPLVLVADDDQDILDIVTHRLERSGYRVVAARDGRQALELARTEGPDLAVLDVMMPHLDGYELTVKLKADPATAGIPVILLTASAQEDAVTRGFEVGAADYVRKPFSVQELRARVEALLRRV